MLAVFDDGRADFALAHKLENAERTAQAEKKLGRREACLEALKEFARLARQVPDVAALGDAHMSFSERNPLFFSHALSLHSLAEEYYDSVDPEPLFRSFDAFFGQDPTWIEFRSAHTEER